MSQQASIAISFMRPEDRDLMDEALRKWAASVEDRRAAGIPEPSDPVYGFAYWLFRYSGLVKGARTT